jgi:hypothetical protein
VGSPEAHRIAIGAVAGKKIQTHSHRAEGNSKMPQTEKFRALVNAGKIQFARWGG